MQKGGRTELLSHSRGTRGGPSTGDPILVGLSSCEQVPRKDRGTEAVQAQQVHFVSQSA